MILTWFQFIFYMTVTVFSKYNYWSIFPHSVILGGLLLLWLPFGSQGILGAYITYILLSRGVRACLLPYQNKGIHLLKRGSYQAAIACFKCSYACLTRHSWLDKYRSLLLLSSSKISYREMALYNIALCYGMLGDGENSLAYYQQLLKEFPHSVIVQSLNPTPE